MGHRVSDVVRVAKSMWKATIGDPQPHSLPVRVGDVIAPLPFHDGMKSEVEDRDIRKFVRKLAGEAAIEKFLAELRGDKKPKKEPEK